MERNVRLEVLDWGGSGRPIILLGGGGNTAYVYDDFAPKLTPNFHVYGITRRGFGASGFTVSKERYPVDRLRDDILAVIDALKLKQPVLAGHSIAGAELSAVATLHPDRIAGLVYLDAGYPYAFDNGFGPTQNDFPPVRSIPFPTYPRPGDSDRVAEAYVTNSTDPKVRDVANAYLRTVDSLTEKQAKCVPFLPA